MDRVNIFIGVTVFSILLFLFGLVHLSYDAKQKFIKEHYNIEMSEWQIFCIQPVIGFDEIKFHGLNYPNKRR